MPNSQFASTFKTAANPFTSKSNAERKPVSTFARATRSNWIPLLANLPDS